MNQIKDIEQLRAKVLVLEQQRAAEWKDLRSSVSDQYERLKPANIIRNAIDGLVGPVDSINTESDILREGAALASGMLVNSIMSGSKNKSLKKWLTMALFSVATYFISKHREEIVEAGQRVMDFVSDKFEQMKTNIAAREARRAAEAETDDDTVMGV